MMKYYSAAYSATQLSNAIFEIVIYDRGYGRLHVTIRRGSSAPPDYRYIIRTATVTTAERLYNAALASNFEVICDRCYGQTSTIVLSRKKGS